MAAPSVAICRNCQRLSQKLPTHRLFSTLSRPVSQRNHPKIYIWNTGQPARCTQNLLPVRFNVSSSSAVPEKEKSQISSVEIRGNSRPVDLTPPRSFNFDTHALVKHLESSGFSTQQAEGLSSAFMQILNSQIEQQTKATVSKGQLEITTQQIIAEIGSVKKDMVILEKSEFSMLKSDTEKVSLELKRLKDNMSDGFAKLQSGVKLDINLERSRAQEAHVTNERTLSSLQNRIETEVANLKAQIEQNKSDLYKYLFGASVSVILGVVLYFLRTMSVLKQS